MNRVLARPTFRFTEIQLLVAPSLMAIVGLLMIFLVPREQVAWTWGDIWVSLAYVGIIAGMSLLFSLAGFRGDQVLFPITATLAALGVLMIQRLHPSLVQRSEDYAGLAQKHFLYVVMGLGVLTATVIGFRHMHLLRRYKYTWLILSIGLMVVTFVFGIEVNGARRWIAIGPIQAQPSELAKIMLVVFLAGYLEDKRDLIGSSWRAGFLRLPPVPYLIPMALMFLASLMVLVFQNDLGSALLFFGIFLVMLYVASGRALYVSVGLLAFAGACWLSYQMFARVGIRVQNWFDPWQDPRHTGFQQIQSDYALASGGLFGAGFGMGRPTLIPFVETDFIFSAIGEELGLLGTLAVLTLFFLLVMRGFAIALSVQDGFARLVAVGLITIIGLQALIIIGGVTRLIPLTGITLPFISYGGSSLLTNFLLIGLLMRISAMRKRI